MSDLRKCRLGNLSNKGKLLVKECSCDEDPVQRPEDSMDYIQDPSFQSVQSSSARHEWSSVTSQKLWRKRLCLE